MQPLTIMAGLFALLFLLFFAGAVLAVTKGRYAKGIEYLLLSLLLVSLAGLAAVTTVAVRGYQAFTHEEVAAVIDVAPLGEQRFSARVTFSDGRQVLFHLAGDEVSVDARILKWKPLFNILGLHTAYELDRIGGRYRDIEDETTKERTVYRLSQKRPVDMFDLGRRYAALKPLIDAEYGSATFTAAHRPGRFEVRVSTTGLLVRPVPGPEQREGVSR